MDKIGLKLAEFSSSSSFHGINHIFGPRLFRWKIAWVLLSAVSASFWFYYLSISLHEFYNLKPTATEVKFVHNNEQTIPTVLLCPYMGNISGIFFVCPPPTTTQQRVFLVAVTICGCVFIYSWGRADNGKDPTSGLENLFPGGIGPLMSYLTQLSQHPMYEQFQTLLSQNISEAFQRFPNIENHWEVLFKKQNVDPNVASIYGEQFGTN